MKSNALIAVLAIALAAGGHAYAQKKAAGPALTPQDYLDIQQLVARYAHAMDTGADNGNAWRVQHPPQRPVCSEFAQ